MNRLNLKKRVQVVAVLVEGNGINRNRPNS